MSTTARLTAWTLGVIAWIALLIVIVALRIPDTIGVVAPALAQVALAVAGGAGIGTAAYGARHFGSASPPSAMRRPVDRSPDGL